MGYIFANNVKAELTAGVSAGDTSITVGSIEAPNNPPPDPGTDTALLTLMDKVPNPTKIEIVSYTGRTDNGDGTYTLSGVSRGLEETSDQSWSSGGVVMQALTAGSLSEIMPEPSLETLAATDVTGSGATLRCAVESFGMIDKDALEIAFDWKEDGAASWTRTTAQSVTSLTTVTESISGLSTVTTYVFRPIATDTLNPETEVIGDEASFTTEDVYIEAPTITSPSDGATDVGETPTFTTDDFNCVNGTDNHESSSWWLYKNSDDTLVWSSEDDTSNLTSISLPGGNQETSTEYRLEVLHTGETYGDSDISSITYTTSDIFGGVIGDPGTQGFGVGIYPGTLPSGYSELTGTTDETSDEYGNYEYSDGSICVFIPKFYYRINDSDNPTYGDYNPNDIDIKGIDTFADETEANNAGYALHRAFIDGGEVKPGFFIDKYMASKHGSNDAALSAKDGVPLSLDDNSDYTNTSGLSGCSGILADAVVLSRARGSGWNAASVFMWSALRLISLAHAQASSDTTNCAWYDSGDTTNYPKGCNDSLGDVDDGEVSYTTAGDSGNADKPLTGSGDPFAKTTHNGQANGVADINGGMWEVMLGLTYPGSDATDSSSVSDDAFYLLKEATALGDLTSGHNGTNDAWGDASHLDTLYDQVNTPIPIGSDTTNTAWGDGSNQVLSAATSGSDRDYCGVFPKDTNGESSGGTNLFGTDAINKGPDANFVPLASGYWGNGAGAGVWALTCTYSRSHSYISHGFRAAAYGA